MKRHSLSHKLFRTYVGGFSIYLMILLGIFVGYLGAVIIRNSRETEAQLMNSIDENVQNYFEKMDAFSMELMNSEEFKRVAINQIPEEYELRKSQSESFSLLYKEAYKMISSRYNVGVVVDDEYYIWMGRYYYANKIPRTDIHTYDTLVRNEVPVVKYLEQNEYLESTSPKDEDPGAYITLSRSMDYRNRYLGGKAILEIQVEKDNFVNEIKKISTEGTAGLKINIYDSDGNIIYEENEKDFSAYVQNGEADSEKDSKETVSVHRIFDDHVTIVYTRDNSIFYEQMALFWTGAVGISLLIIGITFLITYKLSKDISKPIHLMCENVGRIDLKEGVDFEEITTDIDELQFLSGSLKHMNEQIKESLQEIVLLKDYEVHAKMLALQAQMQPHFLFNTLTTIASMAEEEGNEKIYRICMNLNSMFRYIAAEDSDGVHMFEEIRHVENYVEIMRERFPDCHVDIDIPLEMMECRIPKLTIQPLVENAFKYCNRQKPDIRVKGTMNGEGTWTVEVLDNGSGFPAEKKREIMRKCEESIDQEKTLSGQIDGMGLVNVYVRMRLFYGENMSYYIEENRGRIVIGGFEDGENSQLQDKDNSGGGRAEDPGEYLQ